MLLKRFSFLISVFLLNVFFISGAKADPIVVGEDNLTEITGKAQGFKRAAVLIRAENAYGEVKWCSGAMLSKNVLITAGHCVVKNGVSQKNLEVFAVGLPPSDNNGEAVKDLAEEIKADTLKINSSFKENRTIPFGREFLLSLSAEEEKNQIKKKILSAKAVKVWVPEEFKENYKDVFKWELADKDYAFIKLDKEIGKETGVFSIKVLNRFQLSKLPVAVVGYGGDKPHYTIWEDSCHIRKVDMSFFYHSCDTFGGTSGAPIIWKEHPNFIVGINNFHNAEYGYEKSPNAGIRFTDKIIKEFKAFQAE